MAYAWIKFILLLFVKQIIMPYIQLKLSNKNVMPKRPINSFVSAPGCHAQGWHAKSEKYNKVIPDNLIFEHAKKFVKDQPSLTIQQGRLKFY